jgi:SAM-dependent methyltransferase
MHSIVFAHYERLLERFPPGERVLEIGATPYTAQSFAGMLPGREYVGLNIEGASEGDGWRIIEGNGHALPFDDESVDAVICNATLEHDEAFWLTVAETRRVIRPGGIFYVGAPGFTGRRGRIVDLAFRVSRKAPRVGNFKLWGRLIATQTYPFHGAPDDYWRFSPNAFHDVILAGFEVLDLAEVFVPPRIVAAGSRLSG